LDITKDALQAKTEFTWPESVNLPGLSDVPEPDARDVAKAAELIAQAKRPLILAGAGVIRSGATSVLQQFVERTGTPVALTLLGIGGFPQSHPLCLGMMGMHGEAFVNTAIQNADLLLAFGMRFDDRVTGNLKTYAPNAKKIHIEIDPSEIGKNVAVDAAILADLRAGITALTALVEPQRHEEWLQQVDVWRQDTRGRDILHQPDGGKLLAAHVMADIWRATAGNAVVCTDVGQHQMWEAQYYKHDEPRTLITSGGLGTMGFALPAAIGAKLARPDAEVWVIAGDGGFQMTQCELATLQQEKLDIKIAVINNGYLGMVRQWQEFFYDKRYASTPMLSPNFVKLAEAYDIPAARVKSRADVIPTVEKARASGGPMLIEFQVEKEDSVYPMVPAGSDLHKMIRRPSEEVKA
ncbi:MAG TPA: thiamine pyrophosphate-dependent enzyme, partial [Vicinamibacteria bacterium]